MDRAVANALERKAVLQRELAEIEQFLVLYRRFSGETEAEQTETAPAPAPVDKSGGKAPQIANPVRRRSSPVQIAEMAERIVRDLNRPLNRTELVKELEDRDVAIASEDKANYLGTIIWRHARDRLVNLGGKGYWLANEPNEDVGYDPDSLPGKLDRMMSDSTPPEQEEPSPDDQRDAAMERDALEETRPA